MLRTEEEICSAWNKDNPIVSICCLTYNHGRFVEESLNSFLNQKTDFPFEILIHDDASTDDTQAIIKDYVKAYPKIINPLLQKENQKSRYKSGMNPRFNYPRSKGKYIAICEGDDYWTDPFKLQKQVNFLETHPDYVLTHHDANIIDGEGHLIKDSKLPEQNKRDFTGFELKKGPFLLTLSLCFRNKINEYPVEASKSLNGDKWSISLLGAFGKGKYMADIDPAVYRVHSGGVWSSVSSISRNINLFKTFTQLGNYYSRIQEGKLVTYFNKKANSEIFKVLNFYWRQNNYKKFIDNLWFYYKESSDSVWNKYKILAKSLIR